MKYKSKRGLPGGITPQIVGEQIESLKKKSGFVTPAMIVTKAKAKSSPLHDCFTWDDTEAAKLHRINEAKFLLRMIQVEIEVDDEVVITRAFVSIRDDDGVAYQTIQAVLADEDLREQLLQQALQELRSFKQKYAQLKELAAVFAAIDKM